MQASPFIIREVLDLEDKLLIPILDFSLGDDEVIKNLADAAVKMGFSRAKGRKAALAGIGRSSKIRGGQAETGQETARRASTRTSKLGVVLLSRSYMSQDSGANLGIAEKLAQLGVVPIPLDFLPLDIRESEGILRPALLVLREQAHRRGRHHRARPAAVRAGADQLRLRPQLLHPQAARGHHGRQTHGQLEIDEHAAEAGLVTRWKPSWTPSTATP